MAEDTPPIVIRKVIKKSGAHGGSWKVAFADFATAMMAFFLALWILGMTDEEQRGAISEYFDNPSRVPGSTDIPNTNPIQGPGGAMNSMVELNAAAMSLDQGNPEIESRDGGPMELSEDTIEHLAAEQERRKMEVLRDQLNAEFASSIELDKFSDQIRIDIVPDGLRIQIVDEQERPMFDIGSDQLKPYTRKILETIAETINTVPNSIRITGHTDAHRYSASRNYTNWELSADRSNAARRALIRGGLEADKVSEVVGRGSSVPMEPDIPFSPNNRRISIIVLNSDKGGSE